MIKNLVFVYIICIAFASTVDMRVITVLIKILLTHVCWKSTDVNELLKLIFEVPVQKKTYYRGLLRPTRLSERFAS